MHVSTDQIVLLHPRDAVTRPSLPGEGADTLWAEHGWVLGLRHVALIVLAILAASGFHALLC